MGIKQENRRQPSEAWLRQMAELEDSCPSVVAGGMAAELDMLQHAKLESPRVLGRLVEFARRAKGLSVEELAEKANVDLAEVVSIEQSEEFVPATRTVFELATALDLPPAKLLELAGLVEAKNPGELKHAAIRFAAQSEPMEMLNETERHAFEEFVKVLVEGTDGG